MANTPQAEACTELSNTNKDVSRTEKDNTPEDVTKTEADNTTEAEDDPEMMVVWQKKVSARVRDICLLQLGDEVCVMYTERDGEPLPLRLKLRAVTKAAGERYALPQPWSDIMQPQYMNTSPRGKLCAVLHDGMSCLQVTLFEVKEGIWQNRLKTFDVVNSSSIAVADSGWVVVGSLDGIITLYSKSGLKAWHMKTGGGVWDVAICKGVVYAAMPDQHNITMYTTAGIFQGSMPISYPYSICATPKGQLLVGQLEKEVCYASMVDTDGEVQRLGKVPSTPNRLAFWDESCLVAHVNRNLILYDVHSQLSQSTIDPT